MIPFSTTILISGDYAEYEITEDDNAYGAKLVYYGNSDGYAPEQIKFWKQDRQWRSEDPLYNEVAGLLGIAVDIYRYKSSSFEYPS